MGFALAVAAAGAGCNYVDTPDTNVVVVNDYPTDSAIVVYQLLWGSTSLPSPLPANTSSGLLTSVASSPTTAWAVLALGWDPTSTTLPTQLVVLESQSGISENLGDTIDIVVDDMTFTGDCAAGTPLSQKEADFITGSVFASTFAGLHYDAATCTTTPLPGDAGDAGAP